MTSLTAFERGILAHALGSLALPKDGLRLGWRNFFVVEPGSDAHISCERLVRLGMMRPDTTMPGLCFHVTDTGKRTVGCEVSNG